MTADRPTNLPTNQPTDRLTNMKGHRKVTLSIMTSIIFLFLLFIVVVNIVIPSNSFLYLSKKKKYIEHISKTSLSRRKKIKLPLMRGKKSIIYNSHEPFFLFQRYQLYIYRTQAVNHK